jgi:antitoxin (DNA-binding transcriptional repressor) of toxin-antitoxin stability system
MPQAVGEYITHGRHGVSPRDDKATSGDKSRRDKSHARENEYVIFVYTSMQSARVGIREFRENLASYIESSTPVAITRHGETVGFYVPARRKRQQADLDALRKAGEQLDALIAAAGVGEDELVDDFKKARRGARTGKH